MFVKEKDKHNQLIVGTKRNKIKKKEAKIIDTFDIEY